MATMAHETVDERALDVTSSFEKTGDHAGVDQGADGDEKALLALGYKQEFKRDFSLWTTFCVSFSVLGLLPSIASSLSYDLAYSGPAGAVWGWLVAGILIQFVALAMAELCSSMPTAGGLYYASAVLAPQGWGPFFSWWTGWSNFLGAVMVPCSVNYSLSYQIITAISIANPNFTAQTYHVYLLLLVLLVFNGLLAMQSTKFIGRMNMIGTVTNLAVILIFIVWMPLGSKNTPKVNTNTFVWTEMSNGTEWPSGFAFLMGFLTVIWTMFGYDAPFYLSEECSNANIASPRAIMMTAQLGLYLGWACILVIAYTITSIPDVLNGVYGQPMGSLCLQVLGPKAGLAMICLNILAQFFVGQGCTVFSSRIVYAFSRDGVLPGSKWWKRVNKHTYTPVNAVWFVLSLAALLGLLMFAGPVAISAVFSIGAIGQYVAFTTPIALKLFVARENFRPGPWNLGRWSKPVGAVAVGWVSLIIPVLCFPAVKGADLNAGTMNYTCLIYGGTMMSALLWYAVDARKWFKGPKINVEHLIHGRVSDGDSSQEEIASQEEAFGKKDE